MKGQPRIHLLRNQRLSAAEVVNLDRNDNFLNGKDPDYKRKLAYYQASDNPALNEKGLADISGDNAGKHSIAGIGYRYSLFKVDEHIHLESLRQCFLDPEVRIRQQKEFVENVYPRIEKSKN